MAHQSSPGFLPPAMEGPAADGRADRTDRTAATVAAAATRAEPVVPSRDVRASVMLGVGVLVLAAILVFILQNGRKVEVRFLMLDGQLPLGVALLFAVLLGALLVLAIGAARLVRARRARH